MSALPSARQLNQERASLEDKLEAERGKLKALHERHPSGDLSEADQTAWNKAVENRAAIEAELREVRSKIERRTVIDDLDLHTPGRPVARDGADRAFNRSLYEFSIRGMIAAAIGSPIPGLDIGRSIEISQELRGRANRTFIGFPCPIEALSLRADYARKLELRADTISTGLPTAGPGGALIAQVLDASRYVDALRARTVVRQAGAQVISGVVGNLDLPRMKQTGQVAWFNEGDTILKTDEQFDRVSFRPKHCGAISTYSRNMLLQSTPDIEMVIRDDLSRLLALDMDRVALTGSGQGAEPLGVIRNPDCGTIAATEFAYQNSVDLRAQLTGANVPLESLAFIGNSQVDAWSLSALDAMSRPLGKSLVYLGLPDYTSNVCTAPAVTGPPALAAVPNPLILGAWSDMIICFWSELDILPNAMADSVYTTGAVMVRALMTADVNLRHPQSFAWAALATGPVLPPLGGGTARAQAAAQTTKA